MKKHTATVSSPRNEVKFYKGATCVKTQIFKTSAEAFKASEEWLETCPEGLLKRLVQVRANLRCEIRASCPQAEAFLREPLLMPAPKCLDPEQEALYVALTEALPRLV